MKFGIIWSVASLPHLSLIPSLDIQHSHLLHGVGEVVEEFGLVVGVGVDEGLGAGVEGEDLIGSEQAEAVLEVDVVGVVELAGGHGVVEGGHGGVGLVVGAELAEALDVGGVHGGVVVLRGAEVEDAGGELGAVGEADGVGPGEGDHLLDGETPGGEDVDDLGEGHGGGGDVALDVVGVGGPAVAAAEGDGVEGPADHGEEVAGGLGEDVGAGDDAGAGHLEAGLGADDHVEGVAGEGVVDLVVALGGGGGAQEEGGVAPAHHAVVEEQPEGARRGRRDGQLLVGDHLLDDLAEVGAALFVVVAFQLRLRCCCRCRLLQEEEPNKNNKRNNH